jgi:hypothetical protein
MKFDILTAEPKKKRVICAKFSATSLLQPRPSAIAEERESFEEVLRTGDAVAQEAPRVTFTEPANQYIYSLPCQRASHPILYASLLVDHRSRFGWDNILGLFFGFLLGPEYYLLYPLGSHGNLKRILRSSYSSGTPQRSNT